jgi:DNA-binding NtrC family response regulator
VLIVEDEAIVQLHLRRLLAGLGYQVVGTAATADEAVALAQREKPDLVLMDIELRGEGDGIDAAMRLHGRDGPAVVFLTAFADEATLRRTEHAGAVGYIVKPYTGNEIRAVLATGLAVRQRVRALEAHAPAPAATPAIAAEATGATSGGFHGMLGTSEVMGDLFSRICDVARLDWSVLIEGETGTGKEMTAGALHAESPRATGPFVPVNCAGLSDTLLTSQLFGHRRGAFTDAVADQAGFFEAAHGGTLFLDEIADVSAGAQQALLRVLEDGIVQRVGETTGRRVDVRVVSATQRDLTTEVAAGRFRADLLYRLRAVRLALPALRDRGDDIQILANHFLKRAVAQTGRPLTGFTPGARSCLAAWRWPGNVRELRHAVEQATLACRSDQVDVGHLPSEVSDARRGPTPTPADERNRIIEALDLCRGNRAEAARRLGISRATLYRRFGELGIDPPGGVTGEDPRDT